MKSWFSHSARMAFLMLILVGLPLTSHAQQSAAPSYDKAIQAMKAGDLGNALSLMQRAANDYPENPEFQYGLGLVYLRLGRLDEAAAIFETLLRLDPRKYQIAWFDLARIMEARGKNKEALALLKKARPVDPGRADFASGLISMREKDYAGAVTFFRQARSAKKELAAESMIYEAAALVYLKKFDDASKLLEAVLKMSVGKDKAELAKKMLGEIEVAKQDVKRWHLSGLLGFQYDSNVVQSPLAFPGSEGTPTQNDDFAQTSSITGRYDIYRNDPWVFGAGYNHFNITYFDHPGLDNLAVRPILYSYWNKAPFFAGLEYAYGHWWTGSQDGADIHSIYPVFAMGGGNWRTELRGVSEWRDFHNGSPDDFVFSMGITQYYFFNRGLSHVRATFNAGYDETTPRDAGSYHDSQFGVGVQFPVYKDRWFLDVSGYYTLRDFRFSPFFSLDESRKDNEQDLYVILRGPLPLPLAENTQILFILQRTWNDSNILQVGTNASGDPFNFTRTIFSCMLVFEY